MTHTTDEELDALVGRMSKLADDMEKHATYDWDEHEDVRAILNVITALRAKLTAANARADRAEAALAAQIKADAGIADDYTPEKHSGMTLQAHVTGRNIATAIRNQPHDRTALDRLLADAKAKALRRAADEMEDERAKQAILAMIPKEDEK